MLVRACVIVCVTGALLACQGRERAGCREACVESFDLCISMATGGAAVDGCLAKQRLCEKDCGGS